MKTGFYNRTLLSVLRIQIPEFFLDLDLHFEKETQNYNEAYSYCYLGHAENIARRFADICMYDLMVRQELENDGNPFESALIIGSYLVGYYSAVKAFLDAIAITLDDVYTLKLRDMNKDLCRDEFWEKANRLQPELFKAYEKMIDFFAEVRTWRNAAAHKVTPLVLVHGPTSARTGKSPSEIGRQEVEIKLAYQPVVTHEELNSGDQKVEWVIPTRHLDEWKDQVAVLGRMICDDIRQNTPVKYRNV